MAKDVGDAVPHGELFGGETARIDASELFGLIEKTEGTATAERAFAAGTPSSGLPQLAAEVVSEPALVPPLPPRSRWFDIAIGAAVSAIGLSAWYLLTQI